MKKDLITERDLIAEIEKYNPNANKTQIIEAYHFAESQHQGQRRNSGEPYFVHPCHVAMELANLNMDDATIIAGLLHDVLEDTDISYENMVEKFGEEVTKLVDGVTKLKKIKFKSKQENQAENFRKMVLAMASDIRVIIIKLADRLHNMKTLEYMTREKQIEKATETLEIYAPLAHRLGISKIQWQLEDMSLRYLEPEIYYELADRVQKKREERQDFIDEIISILHKNLEDIHIKAEIYGRPKSLYSIYRKMYQQGRAFEEIFDLTAIRALVKTKEECYSVLGVIHSLWRHIPGRFKDYINMPKPNLYQSLHTTVLGPNGEIFEVQIRTFDMHRTAEYGIAAHWKYKEGITKTTNFDEKLTWLRQLMEWQQDMKDSDEFMKAIKEDFSSDEVFVFSPKGDVINLPEGATPIDFAYRVHSAVGNNCIGAKVDGRIVPLSYHLKTGNIVDILTSANSGGPSKDWLKIVKSPQAKTKIKQWFKKEQRDQNIVKGRDNLEKEVRRLGYRFNEILKDEWLKSIAKKMSFSSLDDMYASIGYGSTQLTQIIPKLKDLHKEYYKMEVTLEDLKGKADLEKKGPSPQGIIIKGVDNVQVKFAKCCNPVPGDDIIGYITRGRGVSIHRRDCSNILHNTTPERLLHVYWDTTKITSYTVAIQLVSFDKDRYLARLTQRLFELRLNLTSINAKLNKDKTFTITITIEIKDLEQMSDLIQKLMAIEGTIDAYRVKS